MICYKEVHKYNGHYYSRYDNSYEFVVGEVAEAKGDFIYATDTIDNVLDYAYVGFDMAILEMEVIGNYHKNGYVITSKKVKVLREVNDYGKKENIHGRKRYEKADKGRENLVDDEDTSKLYSLLKERKECLLRELWS